LPIIAGILYAILTWPVLRWLWYEWWNNDYYGHGPLLLVVSALLLWRLTITKEPSTAAEQHTGTFDRYGVVLLAAAMLMYLWAFSNSALYLAALAAPIVLAGLIWTLGSWRLLRRLIFPILLLMLAVPLPFIERATLPLAMWTGVCSGGMLNWLGSDVVITGAAVTLPNTTLSIGAQCSGINSIISLLAVTIVAAYLFEGPLWGRLLLVAAAVPLAMLGNVLRVASLIVVAQQFGVDAAFDFYHTYSGIFFFGAVLVLLIPLMNLCQCKTLRPEFS
jgi:exosortase